MLIDNISPFWKAQARNNRNMIVLDKLWQAAANEMFLLHTVKQHSALLIFQGEC
jgi:hypothetical protein